MLKLASTENCHLDRNSRTAHAGSTAPSQTARKGCSQRYHPPENSAYTTGTAIIPVKGTGSCYTSTNGIYERARLVMPYTKCGNSFTSPHTATSTKTDFCGPFEKTYGPSQRSRRYSSGWIEPHGSIVLLVRHCYLYLLRWV